MSDRIIVVWGAGGHARVVADIVDASGIFELGGFLHDGDDRRAGEPFAGATVLGGRERLKELRASGIERIAIAVGDCAARLELADFAVDAGFALPVLVHPRATLAKSARVADGTVLCAGSIVGTGAKLGRCVIVNTAASVDHECVLHDGVHVGPGAHLGGRVEVGRRSWVALGASVVDGIRVGADTTIGAGAVVVRDIPSDVVAFGVPARPIGARGR